MLAREREGQGEGERESTLQWGCSHGAIPFLAFFHPITILGTQCTHAHCAFQATRTGFELLSVVWDLTFYAFCLTTVS